MIEFRKEDGTPCVMMTKVEFFKRLKQAKEHRNDIEMLDRKGLAKLIGISPNRLSEKPWLLPGYGFGIKGKRNVRWPKDDCIIHLSHPETELRSHWMALKRIEEELNEHEGRESQSYSEGMDEQA